MNAKELTEALEWNIQDLPIGPITISTVDGPQKIDALLLGTWALHQNSQGWAATHRNTGYCMKTFPTPIEALISLGICLGAGFQLPDDMTMETVKGGLTSIPGIRETADRIKAGISVLESWDLDLDYNEPVDPA
jgi:hypothetical protein